MESTDSVGTSADAAALERARIALADIGHHALLTGELEDALRVLTAAGPKASYSLVPLGDKAREAGRYPLAREAYVAAKDTGRLLELGELLVGKAHPLLTRDDFDTVDRVSLWAFVSTVACAMVTFCVYAVELIRTWLLGSWGVILLGALPLLTVLLLGIWLLMFPTPPRQHEWLLEAQRTYLAAGAIARVVVVGDILLKYGYEREARKAFEDAVKCAERS